MPLEDYGALQQSGYNLVPDLTRQLALQAQTASLQAEAQANQEKVTRAQQFQQDIHTYDGSPTAASHLMMKYPEFADHLKQGWDVQDKAKTDADLRNMGEIYSAAQGGNWKLAKQLAHTRADAEKAAGLNDPAYDQTLKIMDTAADGDPTQQKVVLNMLGMGIAAKTGPEHFAAVYGAINPDSKDKGYTLDLGAARYGPDNKMIAHSPFIKDDAGNVRAWTDTTGGGDPASPGAAPTAAPGGFDHAVETVLSNEGGYNPSDMNGAPVNFGINQKANPGVDVKNLTRDQAKQIYHDKYWVPSGAENLPANMQTPYFDVYIRNPGFAKKALAQSGGDPAKFMEASSTYFQNLAQKPNGRKYAEAWANRDAKNTAIATGATQPGADHPTQEQFPVVFPGKSKDAPVGFRYMADGKTLEPIPGGPADDAGLDPDTIHFYAQSVAAGQPMPAMGNGKTATKARQQIMKETRRIMGAEGLSGQDFAIQAAHYKAGLANVSNLEKQLGTVSGNELTFAQNAQQVADLARKLPAQTGSRLLNTPIQSFLRQTNDPTVAALDVAIKTAANEYARLVTASPSGAGTLSDSARLEYQGIIEGNFPLKQKLAALHQMSVDANNRTKSLRSTLQDTYAHLGDRAPELRGSNSKGQQADWITLPSGLKIRKIH